VHENREASRTSARADRPGKVKYPSSGHVRFGGAGPRRNTYETTEQRSEGFRGGSGGKGADQGERRPTPHVSDTERNMRVPGAGRRAPNGAGKEAGTVQRLIAPSDRRSTTGKLLRYKAGCVPGSGRGKLAGIWNLCVRGNWYFRNCLLEVPVPSDA
jgi:hypothetical protein